MRFRGILGGSAGVLLGCRLPTTLPWLLHCTLKTLSKSARRSLEPHFKVSDSSVSHLSCGSGLECGCSHLPSSSFLIFSLQLMMLRTSSLIKKKEVHILVKNKVKSWISKYFCSFSRLFILAGLIAAAVNRKRPFQIPFYLAFPWCSPLFRAAAAVTQTVDACVILPLHSLVSEQGNGISYFKQLIFSNLFGNFLTSSKDLCLLIHYY